MDSMNTEGAGRAAAAVGRRLERLRRERGWTKAHVGRLTRIKPGQLTGYFAGTILPQQEQLERLAKAFDVTVGHLVGDGQGPAVRPDLSPLESRVLEILQEGFRAQDTRLDHFFQKVLAALRRTVQKKSVDEAPKVE